MANAELDRQKLIRLRELLIDSFNMEEIQLLCFDLGLKFEEIAGETIGLKVQNLISYMQRRGELQRLLDEVRRQRPNIDWPDNFDPKEAADNLDENDSKQSESDTTAATYTDARTGLEMIYIPAGNFKYGDEALLEALPDYWIAKTPVTNAHYYKFVRDTGANPPNHWHEQSFNEEIADHPVVYVNWHDAKAFAEWAGMDLPTEEEWEKAARGADGLLYPWGNEWHDGYCNTVETSIGTTTPVGRYSPQGDSPYGCVDMAGNVWEWTASWSEDDDSQRLLRGGSWYDGEHGARAAFRLANHPVERNIISGFRVVRRPPTA